MIATGTANWAKVLPHQLVTNDQYRDYNYWSIDLEVSDEEKARLLAANVKPYKDTNTFKFLLKEKTAKGKENNPPTIVDAAKNMWDKGEIGNGSKVNVSFFTYEHMATPTTGLGKQLKAIQVVEHVPYAGAGGSGVDEFDTLEDNGSEEF